MVRGTRRDRVEFEWADGCQSGPVTLTESFGAVRQKAPTAPASSFFGGYALEGRQRERLTARRGISGPTDLYAMLREFGSSIAGAVTIADPATARRTQPRYEPVSDGDIIARLRRAVSNGDLGSDDQSRSMLAGYQPKLLLARFGGTWYLPRNARTPPHPQAPSLQTLRRPRPRALRPPARRRAWPRCLQHGACRPGRSPVPGHRGQSALSPGAVSTGGGSGLAECQSMKRGNRPPAGNITIMRLR